MLAICDYVCEQCELNRSQIIKVLHPKVEHFRNVWHLISYNRGSRCPSLTPHDEPTLSQFISSGEVKTPNSSFQRNADDTTRSSAGRRSLGWHDAWRFGDQEAAGVPISLIPDTGQRGAVEDRSPDSDNAQSRTWGNTAIQACCGLTMLQNMILEVGHNGR